ncbi:GAF and ANTAR domain-containing protein [Gordonia soli]|uniref:ANTAR domain-containing protein n=1 Tax=Gordonia soli NBRC 108243 TaxID=1223545 RepID=M0QGH3_9ACTN|nr:GAF and ANTAR domain-containing protein [Gordonia soli]GAC67549.1 hypothetical protein GS4_08_01340 [Gordonia soli NBRC 108243]
MVDNVHQAIADLVRTMHAVPESPENESAVLASITEGAVNFVPGAQYAGVLLVDKKKNFETLAPTHPVVVEADQIQKDTDEGPCLEAAWEHSMILVSDMEHDLRFPAFSARTIAETTLRSGLSFQLFTHQGTMGALNIFADEPNVFDENSEEIGLLFATHAALALRAARQQQNFRSALASRDIIGQAKGMIMERFSIDSVAAFELLRRLSQESNTPLVSVAANLVDAEVPTPEHS